MGIQLGWRFAKTIIRDSHRCIKLENPSNEQAAGDAQRPPSHQSTTQRALLVLRADSALVVLTLVTIWLGAATAWMGFHRAHFSRPIVYSTMLLLGSAAFVAASVLVRLVSLGPDRSDEVSAIANREIAATILHLRRRSYAAQLAAIASISLIVCALVAGVAIYVYAGTIVDSEQFRALIDLVPPVKRAIETLETYDRAEALRTMPTGKPKSAVPHDIQPPARSNDIRKLTAENEKLRHDYQDVLNSNTQLRAERDQYLAESAILTAQVGGMRAELKERLPQDLALLKTLSTQLESLPGSSTSRTISTVATRVGALLLVFFLVQVLVPLYRYSMRLSGFYSSRADALLLVHGGNMKLVGKESEALRTGNDALARLARFRRAADEPARRGCWGYE